MAAYDFSQRRALVTGGTQGIGRAVALCLAKCGADVLITGTTALSAEKAADELTAESGVGKVFGTRFAVEDSGGVACLFDEAVKQLGYVDTLVNNAAPRPGFLPASAMTDAELTLQFTASVLRPYELARRVVAGRSGDSSVAIVNVSTAVAHDGASYLSAYAAGKAALANVTKSMAKEWANSNVRANFVTPGPIQTEFLKDLDGRVPGFAEIAVKSTLLGRLGTPEEVANAVVFLASDEASYITGAELEVAGGLLK